MGQSAALAACTQRRWNCFRSAGLPSGRQNKRPSSPRSVRTRSTCWITSALRLAGRIDDEFPPPGARSMLEGHCQGLGGVGHEPHGIHLPWQPLALVSEGDQRAHAGADTPDALGGEGGPRPGEDSLRLRRRPVDDWGAVQFRKDPKTKNRFLALCVARRATSLQGAGRRTLGRICAAGGRRRGQRSRPGNTPRRVSA
jgi:hypothetical protein